jgi:hypothetical protein
VADGGEQRRPYRVGFRDGPGHSPPLPIPMIHGGPALAGAGPRH